MYLPRINSYHKEHLDWSLFSRELYEQLQEKESIAKEGNSDNQNIPLKTKGIRYFFPNS